MKKIFVFVAFLSFISINTVLADNVSSVQNTCKKSPIEVRQHRGFEQRLGLSDEQKAKAREIRTKGHEKLHPIVEEIMAKKQEAKMIKMSRMAVQMQEEKLAVIDEELKVLEKRAHDIRKENMKEFESILTKQQKKTLKNMKKEGRKRYHAEHPAQMQFKIQPPTVKK